MLLLVRDEVRARHNGGVTQLAGDDRGRGRAGCLLSSLLSLYLSLSLGRYLYFIILNILSRPRMEQIQKPDQTLMPSQSRFNETQQADFSQIDL